MRGVSNYGPKVFRIRPFKRIGQRANTFLGLTSLLAQDVLGSLLSRFNPSLKRSVFFFTSMAAENRAAYHARYANL